MTKPNSDTPIDGKDYFSDFYSISDTENPDWTVKRIHAFIKGMFDDGFIYRATDVELRTILSANGLLNTSGQHEKFLKNLIRNRHSEEGKEIIQDFVDSDKPGDEPEEDTGKKGSIGEDSGKGSEPSDEEDVLKDDKNDIIKPGDFIQPEKIFSDADYYNNISVDEEIVNFFICNAKNKLWADVFTDEKRTLDGIKKVDISNNHYRESIHREFMKEYLGAKKILVPKFMTKDCNFKTLNLMQKLVAYKIKTQPFFANFSGTGSGKTLSAILASHTIKSKITLVVCPNETVKQWGGELEKRFGTENVYMKKDIFNFKLSEKPQFLVLNWEMLQNDYSESYFVELLKNKIDFVILDEVHLVKIRSVKKKKSNRRDLTEQILYEIKEKNPDLRLLFMTATPVINNLTKEKLSWNY